MYSNLVFDTKNAKTTWNCPVSKTTIKTIRQSHLFFLYFVILCKGRKTIVSYVLAKQTKTVKNITFAYWSIQ